LGSLLVERGGLLLEEGYLANRSRWHRLTEANLAQVRARLAPRARLLAWPDLSTNLTAVLAGADTDDLAEVVWQRPDGRVLSRLVNRDSQTDVATVLTDAVAASVVSQMADRRHPLLAAVLPDPDGVLRARWTAE